MVAPIVAVVLEEKEKRSRMEGENVRRRSGGGGGGGLKKQPLLPYNAVAAYAA